MKKIKKVKDHWGQNVIYVQKCTRFEYETNEDLESIHNIEELKKVCDILK